MNKVKEQYKKIIEHFPKSTPIDRSFYHLGIPIDEEIILDINFKNYPKCPKAKLINQSGNSFKLDKLVTAFREWDIKNPPSILETIDEILLLVSSMKSNKILIGKEFLEGMMKMCQECHPQKLVGLLGVNKGIIVEFILPTRACTDPNKDFELFRTSCSIPFDLSYEGTFLSRPSGELLPNEKLNDVYKRRRFTMLLAHPYDGTDCIRCFDNTGRIMDYEIIEKV